MKLKRIISALLVFTMVMACSVCAVSANGTYQVTTSYDVSTQSVTVNATLAGAAADSMVSYLIVKPVTTEEGTSYEVLADGSNILHIDQATANGSGAASYDTATIPFAKLNDAKVKFVSSASETLDPFESFTHVRTGVYYLTYKDEKGKTQVDYNTFITTEEFKALSKAEQNSYKSAESCWSVDNYTKSVTKFTDLQKGIIISNLSDSGQATTISYVTKDGAVYGAGRGTNLTTARWADGHYDELFAGEYMYEVVKNGNPTGEMANAIYDGQLKQYIPVDDVVAWVVDIKNTTLHGTDKNGNQTQRETATEWKISKKGSSFNGRLNEKEEKAEFIIYNNYNEAKGNGENVDLTINGLYKEDVTDGYFGNIKIGGGDFLFVYKQNTPIGNTNAQGSVGAELAMTVDADPIYGTFTSYNNGIEYPAVTILVSATDVAIADKAGLKLTAVTKGAATINGAYPANVEKVDLGICPNAYTGTANFAIQLFDSANEGYLNPDKYDIIATPVINENGAWTELSTLGEFNDSRYFTVARGTTATEAAAE